MRKQKTNWLLIAGVVVLLVVTAIGSITYTVKETASPETLRQIAEFAKDFRWGEITLLPEKPKPIWDTVQFFWELWTQ